MKFPSYLRVAIVTSLGIFEINSTEKRYVQITGGLEAQLLDMISEGLKFKYTALIPKDKEWGRQREDGEWTGIIGMVSKNEADIGISKLGIYYDRLSVVDFSYTYSIEDITFATKPPGLLSKEIAVFLPFSVPLWIAFSTTLIFMTFVFKFILKENYRFQDIFLYIIGSILMSAQRIKFDKIREKILVTSWLFSSMFLSYSYMAVLLAFLTVPLKEQAITDKYRLLEVLNKGNYKCVTQDGSFILKTLLKSGDKSVVSIANYIERNKWYIPPTKNSTAEALKKDKVAVVSPRNNFRFSLQDKIYVPDDNFFSLFWGIAVSKNFCCLEDLNSMIHRISAAGLYLKAQNDFYFQLQLKDSKNVIEEPKSIKPLILQDLVGAFFFLLSGYVLGGIILVIEIVQNKKRKK